MPSSPSYCPRSPNLINAVYSPTMPPYERYENIDPQAPLQHLPSAQYPVTDAPSSSSRRHRSSSGSYGSTGPRSSRRSRHGDPEA